MTFAIAPRSVIIGWSGQFMRKNAKAQMRQSAKTQSLRSTNK
jgi:hypothetical protein